jgi:hypothetical protein
VHQGSQKHKARLCGSPESGIVRLKIGIGAKHNSPRGKALERVNTLGESRRIDY